LIGIQAQSHKEQINQLLSLYLSPEVKRWQMDSEGLWKRVLLSEANEELMDIQEYLIGESRVRR
jgi:polyphosphate kinase